MAPKLGIENTTLNVNQANFKGLDISSLRIFSNEKIGISLESLNVKTQDTSIQSINIDGLDLNFELNDGKFYIPGLTPPKKGETKKEIYTIPSILSTDFSVSVINSELTLNIEKKGEIQEIKIPFEIELTRNRDIISFNSNAKGLHYKDDKFELSLPECEVSGSIRPEKTRLMVTGTAKFANISLKTKKVRFPKIEGVLPFAFYLNNRGVDFNVSDTKKQKPGSINIPEIYFGKRSLGNTHFSIHQQGGSFFLDGVHAGLIKDQKTFIKGKITPPSGKQQLSADLKISFEGENLDIDLNQFHPKAGAANFMGNINVSAGAAWRNNTLSAQSRIKVEKGIFEDKERNFAIFDIELDFELSDALKLKSKPSQTLSFESLKYKTFLIDNGKISFQTNSLKNYLIEKSEFKWCNGNVASNAFSIDADKPDEIDIALYCNRLNVANLLNQLQLGKASGKGNVSGKIPLIYKNRKIRVDEGFLYSTPGIGGNICLTDFLGPLANLPAGFQMDIAKEALHDFDYEWLKLRLNSEKEDLLIQLEMDGAPADLLPFGYDLKRGGLFKSTDPEQKARFKGISFQINFRLPANQMLDYGTKIKEIPEKLK